MTTTTSTMMVTASKVAKVVTTKMINTMITAMTLVMAMTTVARVARVLRAARAVKAGMITAAATTTATMMSRKNTSQPATDD